MRHRKKIDTCRLTARISARILLSMSNGPVIAIRYTAVVNGTSVNASARCTMQDAVEAAAEALEAYSADEEATWIYRASETQTDWKVSRADMARLGAALLDGRTLEQAYSIWCSSSDAEEMSSDDALDAYQA